MRKRFGYLKWGSKVGSDLGRNRVQRNRVTPQILSLTMLGADQPGSQGNTGEIKER
jgi:hypothetical protein